MVDADNQAKESISLDVLAVIHAARSAHGLRQDDFELYRHFCTKRAARLRRALKLQHTVPDHKNNVPFQKSSLTPDQVTDTRHLEIVLFDAERAFVYAKELKEGTRDEPAKRHHMRKRLKRASGFAKDLASLATQARVDTMTQLGIKAYSGIIHGELAQEMQEWSHALEHFYQSLAIYQGLVQVAPTPLALAIAQAAISDMEPHIRFCQYHLQGSSSKPVDPAQWDCLTQETKEVAGKSQQEAQIQWFGETLTLRDTKVAEAMAKAQKVETEASGSMAGFQAWARVVKILRRVVKAHEMASAQVRRPKGPGVVVRSSEEGEGELLRFVGAVEWKCLRSAVQCDVDRVRLIDTTSAKGTIGVASSTACKELGSDQPSGLGWREAVGSVDRILHRLSRTSTRTWVQEDARVQDLLEEATEYFTVMRSHTIASLYASRAQRREAYALESRALCALNSLHVTPEAPSSGSMESMRLVDPARDDLAVRIRRAKVLAHVFSTSSPSKSLGLEEAVVEGSTHQDTWPTHLWGYQGARGGAWGVGNKHGGQWVEMPMSTSSLLPKPIFLDVVYDRVAQVPDDVYVKAGRAIPPRPLTSASIMATGQGESKKARDTPSRPTAQDEPEASSSGGLWSWLGGR